jgi:hypothetical protein
MYVLMGWGGPGGFRKGRYGDSGCGGRRGALIVLQAYEPHTPATRRLRNLYAYIENVHVRSAMCYTSVLCKE